MKKILFALLIFSACTKKGDLANDSILMPINNGSEWVYADTLYTGPAPEGLFPLLKKQDTLKIKVIRAGNYNGNDFLKLDYRLFYIVSPYDVFRSDSGNIYSYNEEENKEYCLFRKVIHIDTISVSNYSYSPDRYYVPVPTTNILPEPPKLVGKQYHIAYPESVKIGNYTCYRNEHLACDENNKLIKKVVYFVAPGVGMVRTQLYSYSAILERWDRTTKLYLRAQYDLVSYKLK